MENKIKNWFNHNWFKFLIVVAVVFVIGGYFYWYAYRPSKIRHDCSWVKKSDKASPEITQKQYDECVANQNNNRQKDFEDCTAKGSLFCDLFLNSICPKPHPATPVKEWWEPANKNQYDFCIHEKGL